VKLHTDVDRQWALDTTDNRSDSDLWRLDKVTSQMRTRFLSIRISLSCQTRRCVSFWNVRVHPKGGENALLPVANLLEWLSERPDLADLEEELATTQVSLRTGPNMPKGSYWMCKHDRTI